MWFSPAQRNFPAIVQARESRPHTTGANWTHGTSWHCVGDYFCITIMNSSFYFLPFYYYFLSLPPKSPSLTNQEFYNKLVRQIFDSISYSHQVYNIMNHLASINWSETLPYEDTWNCSALEKIRLRENLISAYKCVMDQSQVDGTKLFTVVPCNRTRGNGHQLEPRSFIKTWGKMYLL